MAISTYLIQNDNVKIIGFTGGLGRNHLLSRFIEELTRSGKKIVVSHLGHERLPVDGHIVLNDDRDGLLDDLRSNLSEHPVVYAGRGMADNMVAGITPEHVQGVRECAEADYLLLNLGLNNDSSLLSAEKVAQLCKMDFLDQMLYCFRIDTIDTPLDDPVMQTDLAAVAGYAWLPEYREYSQEFMVRYLTGEKDGALPLFRTAGPCSLIFTDVNRLVLENRAINLGRDLMPHDISSIYFANLKRNMVKKVS